MNNPTPKPRGRPKKSAIDLGIKQTARVSARRAIRSTIGQTAISPLLKLALIAAVGAVASHFINKK